MNAAISTSQILEADPSIPDFFLGRLAAIVARQAAVTSPAERMTLSIAAFSIFLDCLNLGLGDRAVAIIRRLRPDGQPLRTVAA